MKELLEAGVHFGHQTKRWNPKMKEYIFGERNGIYIIDLQKTLKMFKDASKFVQDHAAEGKTVLFVGTKRQAQEAIAVKEARKLGIPVVAVVDTNCDPTEVDWVIPGNDDALRAIRLFASKIADSIAEGVQAGTDKQTDEIAGAAAAGEAQPTAPAAAAAAPTSADLAEEDELNMEEVLGGRVRKAPESETTTPEVVPDMDVGQAHP